MSHMFVGHYTQQPFSLSDITVGKHLYKREFSLRISQLLQYYSMNYIILGLSPRLPLQIHLLGLTSAPKQKLYRTHGKHSTELYWKINTIGDILEWKCTVVYLRVIFRFLLEIIKKNHRRKVQIRHSLNMRIFQPGTFRV